MGFLDSLRGKKEENAEEKSEKEELEQPVGKYTQECSLCGKPGTEKKWMGQYWHKKCYRSMRKGAKKMI